MLKNLGNESLRKKGGNQNWEIIPLCTLWENVMPSLTGTIAEIIETCIRVHDRYQ